MDSAQLTAFQGLCQTIYTGENAARTQAEQALAQFQTSVELIPQCHYVIESAASPYAVHYAATSLLKLYTNNWNVLTLAQRMETKNTLLQILASRGTQFEHVSLIAVVQVIARITKLGWCEEGPYREVIEEASSFLQMSPAHLSIGLNIYRQIINEVNSSLPNRTITQHRKTAISFRDNGLLKIFQISLNSLKQLGAVVQASPQHADKVAEQAMTLFVQCTGFDFIGATNDETSDDLAGTLQIPSGWRTIFEDPSTMQMFYDLYGSTQPPRSVQCLECLVQFASVRRSLFMSEAERLRFLQQIMAGMTDILRSQKGLNNAENYHEFCRLLARIKSNYQIVELVSVEGYREWITLVYNFTITSLKTHHWAPNSKYYLLGLWGKLVASLPYLRGETPSGIDTYAPEVVQAYVQSRLELVERSVAAGETEELFEDEEAFADQLEALPSLGRCQYPKITAFIISLMDPLMAQYSEYHVMPNTPQLSTDMQIRAFILEAKLAWLVYILGCLITGRLSSGNSEENDTVDGEIVWRVFQLRSWMDARLLAHGPSGTNERLELSVISFMNHFRKVYIGDQTIANSKMYQRLSERMPNSDLMSILDMFIEKVATNLKAWSGHGEIITKTLTLFHDLSAGYGSGKNLTKLPKIEYLYANHGSEFSTFLNTYIIGRNRTTFYTTLTRLLFLAENFQQFDEYMAPLERACEFLLSQDNATAYRTDVVSNTVIGLCRDLTGVCMACNQKRTYLMLFDWIYPRFMPIFARTAEVWFDSPKVTTALLKFISEFVHNKSQRLSFDISSPNGILLFREISSILTCYGSPLISRGVLSDPYLEKYKGISICMILFSRILTGNYVNFGVFNLYGDKALDQALSVVIRLIVSIPVHELLKFPKVNRALFTVIETLVQSNAPFLLGLDQYTFGHIMNLVQEGIKSTDMSICSLACSSLDNLISYPFIHPRDTASSQKMQMILQGNPSMFTSFLHLLFNTILYEESGNQWNLSRPLFSLIMIQEQQFSELRSSIVAQQPQDRQTRLHESFEKLMQDVQKNLDTKNRDKFTQNLTLFRHEVKGWIA